ncbi:MAG: translesion DNA synthesis-associated protein ImuA [Gammaproteobacteria bacterium]|nr:translesion DNA synthesis-associated protein ImuA [Gammaproteobacteria bacterium]MYF27341.1 translesion DNA synthesis-associated protein ImuA [Gammaproteobacteria bacterium]MYK45696.1 translesion DNA synthesis-associated protein ImuA [Gammaproteobacteria bacterium]
MLEIPDIEGPITRTLPNLWRASELPGLPAAGISSDGIETGFPALDDVLFDHGWPRAGLTELLLDDPGIGELTLLAPALASLSTTEERLIAWVAPPFVPFAPALASLGIDVSKMLLVYPDSHADALWTLEQVLKIGACSALLAWPAEHELKFAEIRRLQFAARQGRTWAGLFRSTTAAGNASPAELRLRLWPHRVSRSVRRRDGLRLDVVKRRGGWPLSGIELDFADIGTRSLNSRETMDGSCSG